MSNVNHGLRFDIYERVNLPENVAPIEELEEIELVPRIQIHDQGEYALLQGQLVLNGIYRGQGTGQEQIALEHWIPVEISLPMNRVQQLDEITVDIDTFDVEHLSERALNITGVLSLRGISIEEQADEWQPESFTAQQENSPHSDEGQQLGRTLEEEQSNDYESLENEQAYRYETEMQTSSQYEEQEQQLERYEQSNLEMNNNSEQHVYEESPIEGQQEEEWIASGYNQEEDLERAEAWSQTELYAPSSDDQEASREEDQSIAQSYDYEYNQEDVEQSESAMAPAQPEPQIAFSQNSAANETIGIRDILSSSLREQAAHEASRIQAENERIQQEESKRPTGVEDEIVWQQLFLSKRDEQNEFKKIKMYIVQKDDTLDQIALRYEISARDILTHNKLHESAISEGQLIYIP